MAMESSFRIRAAKPPAVAQPVANQRQIDSSRCSIQL
jgi:hypothetical protein